MENQRWHLDYGAVYEGTTMKIGDKPLILVQAYVQLIILVMRMSLSSVQGLPLEDLLLSAQRSIRHPENLKQSRRASI